MLDGIGASPGDTVVVYSNTTYSGILGACNLSPDAKEIAYAYDDATGEATPANAIIEFPKNSTQTTRCYYSYINHSPPTAPFIYLGMQAQTPEKNPYDTSITYENANAHDNYWAIFRGAAKYDE